MADGEAEGTETPEEEAKPKKPMGALVLGVVNLAATGFLVFKTLTAPAAHGADMSKELKEIADRCAAGGGGDEGGQDASAKVTGPLLAVDPIVVNLSDEGGTRYLKVSFEVEVEDGKAKSEFTKQTSLIRAEMMAYLSGLTVADTLGEENKQKIAAELAARANKFLGGDAVRRVLFKDFVLQ